MQVRFVLIAIIALTSAGAAAAEPQKAPAKATAQLQPASPRVMLASADEVRSPAASEPQVQLQSKRPRVARVTTCRCGDQQPTDSDDQQEQ